MYTTSGDELHPSSRLTSGKLDDNSASKEPVDLESPLGHNLVLHEINQTMRDLDQFNCRHYGGSTGLRLYGLHSRPQFRPLRDVTQEQEGDSLNVNNIFNDNREINNDTDGSRNDNQNSNNKPSYATNSRANWTDGDGNGARCAAKLPSAMWAPSLHLLLFVLVILAQRSSVVESIDCFICQSRNGSNPACDDPFHNIHSVRITTPALPDNKPNVSYHTPCYTARKGRDGLFPASACLKLSGRFENGETIVVRHCGLDSGTLTQDTEIVRMSHCGNFQLDGSFLKGCVMACAEDACNSSPPSSAKAPPPMALLLLLAALLAAMVVHHRQSG